MEYETITKRNFEIIKLYPSFSTFVKREPEVIAKPRQEEQQPAEVKKEDKVRPKLAEFDRDDFCKEEIDDPDYIENLKSLKVLEMKIKETQAQIDKIEGRAPQNLREKLIKLRVKYKVSVFNVGYRE